MGCYIGKSGYYEGDRFDAVDLEVTSRPSIFHSWENGEWVDAEDAREYKHFTGLAKLDLFTNDEQDAVIAAGLSSDVQVKRFYDRLIVADYLTYSDPQVEQGLQLLLARELLTPERKDAIVTAMTATRQ